MSRDTFEAFEHVGSTARAGAYDHLFAKISNQAVDPILHSFGPLMNRRHLDVACRAACGRTRPDLRKLKSRTHHERRGNHVCIDRYLRLHHFDG